MVENGADINAKDEDGKTALILATMKGRLKIVEYLIENNAKWRKKICLYCEGSLVNKLKEYWSKSFWQMKNIKWKLSKTNLIW